MLPRFQHILVPVDFTEKNRAALDVTFETAAHNQARVTLLHVIMTFDYEDDEINDFYVRLESAARKKLETMAQRFIDGGVRVEYKVRFGSRASEIVQCAAECGVDLIVMSSHTVDPEKPAQSLSTISYQVSMLCQCPVMLMK